MGTILNINSLSKSYHKKYILNNISLKLTKGSFTGLMGKNGSGKTSFLEIISGLRKPKSGEGSLNNYPLFTSDYEYRKYLIFWGHNPLFYPSLSGFENIQLFLSLRNKKISNNEIHKLFDKYEIQYHINHSVREYSIGQIQRLKLIQVSLVDWDVGLFDEPTSGMDDSCIEVFNFQLSEWKKNGKTILLASHHKDWLNKYADDVIIINNSNIKKV